MFHEQTSYLEVLYGEQLFRPLSGSHQAVMTDYYSVINDRAPVRHRYPRYSCFISVNIAFKPTDIFEVIQNILIITFFFQIFVLILTYRIYA